MRTTQLRKVFSIGLLLFISFSKLVFGQTGKISGKVLDKETGETLIGLTVGIEGTTKGVITDVQGRYVISGLTPGKYNLNFRYLGYQTKQVTGVEVKNGQVVTLDVQMETSSSQNLKEVVVTATYRKETIGALYAQQKNSASISDGVSSEVIKKSPDRNTSDVLKRVSGATVQDNKFVVIRGLSDRYNIATLDGAVLPSTEPNRKAFSFDIVPSNLVDNLVITKTATPDLPGDFVGGAVQIQTKDIPDKDYFSVSIGTGYNTVSTFKDFYSGPRATSDYFGFDGSDKNLPSGFPSTKNIQAGLTPEQNIAALRQLPNDWNIYNKSALPSQSYQFTLGNVKSIKGGEHKLGSILSLTYRNGQSINPEVYRNYYDYRDYNDNVYKFSTNLGALANFAYTYGKSKITFKNIYNRIYDDQFLQREGTNMAVGGNIRYYAFDLMQKSLFKTTLEGNHAVGENNSKINWSLSYNNVMNNQPDQRKVNYIRQLSDPDGDFYASVTTAGKENTRLFSDMKENSYSAILNYSLPVNLLGAKGTFKAGLNSQYRDRIFDARFLGMVMRQSDNDIRARYLDNLFADDLIAANIYSLEEIPNNADSYTANSFVNAAYAMMDNKIGEKSRLVWGLRVEQFNVQLDTKDKDPRYSVNKDYLDFLPSLNYTYSVSDKINLRASYYRTLARPEFRELAVSAYYDYETLSLQQGSPSLDRSLIDNADIRFEFYPSVGQILSVSAFYKKFKDAIEVFNNDATSTRTVTYFNSPDAEVYGLEIEARKTLDFIKETQFLKNTTVYSNVALVKSRVENGDQGLNNIEKERPMVGQAPYVINAGLQHSFMDDKFSFNALYNVVGRRLNVAKGGIFESIWEQPRNIIDLQLSAKVIRNKGEVKLNVGDVFNQRSVFYFDMDQNKKYDRDNDFTLSSFKPGTNYSLSFSYTF